MQELEDLVPNEQRKAFVEAVHFALESKIPIVPIYNELIVYDRYRLGKLIISMDKNHPLFCKLTNPRKEKLLEVEKENKIPLESYDITAWFNYENEWILKEGRETIKIKLDKASEFRGYIFLLLKTVSSDFLLRVFSTQTTEVCEAVFQENTTQKILSQNLYPLRVNELTQEDKQEIFDYVNYDHTNKEVRLLDKGKKSYFSRTPFHYKGMNIDIFPKLNEEIDGHWRVTAHFKPVEFIQKDPSINIIYTSDKTHELQEGDIMLAEIKKNTNIEGVIDQAKKHVRHIKQLCYKTENIFYLLILQGNLTPNDMPSDNFGLPELEFEFDEQVKFFVVCLTTNTLFGHHLDELPSLGSMERKFNEMIDEMREEMREELRKEKEEIRIEKEELIRKKEEIIKLLAEMMIFEN